MELSSNLVVMKLRLAVPLPSVASHRDSRSGEGFRFAIIRAVIRTLVYCIKFPGPDFIQLLHGIGCRLDGNTASAILKSNFPAGTAAVVQKSE